MIDRDQLAQAYAVNLNIIKRQAAGLSHADSLLQPPFRGNCLNWVLGHIAVNRDRVLRLLGEEPVLSEAETARYATGSEPVTGDQDGVLKLEELLERLGTGQERTLAGFQRAADADMDKEIEIGEQTTTVGRRLFGLYFHETYHTGQTELLRQLAGTDDKVI